MLSSYERLMIGRYLLPKGEGRVVVLIGAIGLFAVAIGVAALIIVMSVMNGARTKLTLQFAGVNGHASIIRPGNDLAGWRALHAAAARDSAVLAAVPKLEVAAMASVEGRVLPARVQGLRAADARAMPYLIEGGIMGRRPLHDGEVVVGSELALQLGATVGSSVTMMRPSMGSDGLSVKSVDYLVSGVIHTGVPQHDVRLVLMNLSAAQALSGREGAVSRIDLVTADAERAGEFLAPLARSLTGGAILQTWRELNKPIFDALAMDKVGMFVALSLIVVTALFNILSSLVMLVRSKLRDIAIMRTMGASRASILKIFLAIGMSIGTCGALLGSSLGLGFVGFRAELARFLKSHLLGSSYTDELTALADLPASISAAETAAILALALGGTLLATLYPAARAARVDPAAVLRHT